MENKNTIFAIVLCLAIMFGWAPLAEHMGWMKPLKQEQALQEQQQKAAEQQKAQEIAAKEAEQARLLPAFTPSAGRDVSVETPLFKATIYSGGAILRSFDLKKYHQDIKNSALINLVDQATAAVAPLGLLVNGQPSWSVGKWQFEGEGLTLAAGQSKSLTFVGEVDNIRVTRTLTFNADSYYIQEKVALSPLGDNARSARLSYTVAADSTGLSEGPYDSMRVAWFKDGKMGENSDKDELNNKGIMETGQISWAGVMNTYFMSAVLPAEDGQAMNVKGRLQNGVYRTALEQPEILLNPGQEKTLEVSYWIGPKERKLLADAPNNLSSSIDLGMFSMIAKALLWMMDFFQQYAHNWGISIILLTVFIKAVFWPLTAKSYSSMEKMKKLQPLMQAIREKHKDDKEAMNKEVMALYKTYGVNPASGCVPILVQLPVFFGLYQALLTSIELRHASFISYLPGTDLVWLADLASKDPYYITPVIMGVTMFLQQKMSPPAGDPMQQKIMMFLPIIFTVMFLGFPAGLVIYWLVNNVLSILQQWLMIRKNRNAANAA
ncbi:MAG: membrane protein insertase YidC [Desulfovibrionaceae bacterium]|nr:membrane protein insertase YidC [Desulfovibrionaceae bacterium]